MGQFQEELQVLLGIAGVLAVPALWVAYMVFAAVGRNRQTEASMKKTAAALGLRYEDLNLRGEQDGVAFQIALQTPKLSGQRGTHYRYVVRAKVPGLLPLGFVAQPSKWTSWSEKNLTLGNFTSGNAALDQAYFFKTNDEQMSSKLLEEPEVQQALEALMELPPAAGLVLDDHVYIAFEEGELYPGTLQYIEGVRRCIDTVVKAALVMDRTYSRLKQQTPAALAS